MDIENLLTILNNLNDRDLDTRLYFTRKKQNGRYQSYSPTIGEDLQVELKNLVVSAVAEVQDSEQRQFSPVGTIEGCVETCTTDEINNFRDIIESMNDDFVNRKKIPDDEISKLTFYCFKIFSPEGDILFFRRVTKFHKLKKGFFGKFSGDDFEKLNDTLLGIDPSIDIVVFQGEMLILSHISLERIFSISDQYRQTAAQTLDLVNRANRITNFTQFREDCLSDGRVTRALTKLLNEEERIHQVFENFENVIRVIDIFGLNIDLAEENTKLVYEDKSQLLDITRLMRDSFYVTYINNRDGFDEGI
ncbi:Kiwa anti-phage protein KwaB-like domain-containing protein [Bacillus paralicheniformis]|uniref:Kiwa anti-phage protein KwaB-like domain-containing protein n=1 Tax=Bacillus TaxID=1386 RepID=UPI000BBD1A8E|nr:Kiwa anti-phage protein KwaB-like domain-containing protein [Bacillus paralicheniformis]